MSARPENEFPTIADARDRLSELIEQGFGDFPVKILVVPNSTLQAIARAVGHDEPPALMIDLGGESARMPFVLIATEGLRGGTIMRTQ